MVVDSPPMLGRQAEQTELALALSAASAGEGALVLLAGGAGSGKSRLVEECLTQSHVCLLSGVATESTTAPYGPVIQTIRSALRVRPDALVDCGSLAQHLALILPELGSPPRTTSPETLLEAIRSFFVSMTSKTPVVLLLDDLQWSDNATLELLPYLATSCAHERLLILGVYRNDEIPRAHPIRRLRNTLRRSRVLHEITLEPLDDPTTLDLASRIVGRPLSQRDAEELIARADGVPLFIEELANSLRLTAGSQAREETGVGGATTLGLKRPIPETLRDALLLRLDGLPEDALRLLEVAAVVGREVEQPHLEKLAGNLDGIDTLLSKGLLTALGAGRLAFRQALMREVIYQDISWGRLRALHRNIAVLLENEGAPSRLTAEHWQAAREPTRACNTWRAAAREAAALYAYRDAVTAAQLALEFWPDDADIAERLHLVAQLGTYAQLCGMLPEAAGAWREVAAGWQAAGDLHAYAEAERNLASATELQGHWERALAARQSAAGAFAASGRHAEAAIELLSAAAHARSAARFQSALELLSTAADEAQAASRVDLQARIQGLEGNVRARMGHSDEGLSQVRQALARALEINDAGAAAEVYQRLADSLEHTGDYAGAQDTYLTAFTFCQANANAATAQLCIACLTVVLRQTGEWERAMTLCREVLASEHSAPHSRAVASGTLGALYVMTGRPRRAQPLLADAATLARKIELAAMELLTSWGLAQIAELNGMQELASEHCQDMLRRWEQLDECHFAIPALRWAATFFASTQESVQVRACVNALAQIASRNGQPESLSALAHALGESALLDGDASQAVNQFDQALDLLRDLHLPYCRALTQWRCGVAHLSVNHTDIGILHLKSAYRTARKLRARPLAKRIASTLREVDDSEFPAKSRNTPALLGAVQLTRRQREILQHVARGLTNAEIARLLFLSPRTVEMHVGNILAALDSSSRADAVRRAAELNLLDSSR